MVSIDINCDMGESFGRYKLGNDAEIMKYVSSVNIACGFHAGDPVTMSQTVDLALNAGMKIGAHPGFPDLIGFGRRKMNLSFEEAKANIIYQIGALKAIVESKGGVLHHVKPHGALYNMASSDEMLARALAEAVYEVDDNLVYMGLSGSKMLSTAEQVGLKTAHEVFADRAYTNLGSLVSRRETGAVIHDSEHVVIRVLKMVKEKKVLSVTGEELHIKADTICLHGDTPNSVVLAKAIYEALSRNDIEIKAL